MSGPAVPLAALLSHPALAGLVVLGDGDSDPTSIGVETVVARSVATASEAAPRALLVLLTPVEATDWKMDAIIRQAHVAGASALVLASTSPLPLSASALARRLALPVYGTDDPFTTGAVARDLILARGSHTAAVINDTVRALRRPAGDVEHLVRSLAAAIAHPIHLVDATGHQFAGTAPAPPIDPAELRRLPSDAGAQVVPLADRLLITVPVPLGEGPGVWLGAVAPGHLPADAAAIGAALEVAVHAVGRQLAVDRLADERDARLRAALLGELADAVGAPPPELRRRAIHAGWSLDGWHIGIRVNPRTAVDTVARRTEVLAALADQGLRCEAVEQADGWAVWTSLDSEPAPTDVDRVAKAIRRAHRALSTTLSASVGVGAAHQGPSGLVRSLAEANDAARLAESRPASGYFVHIDQLGLAQLLLAWTRTDTFQPAARTLLEPLAGQPGDLLRTLTAYLDAESSLVEAAAVLGVHRNTVAGRIARTETLLGVRLDDPETRLALHLACRANTSG